MRTISRYIAVGGDEASLRRLTEHLPWQFVLVTTPASLNAQLEASEEAFFLVDDTAPAECLKGLANSPCAVWLGAGAQEGVSLAKPVRLGELTRLISQRIGPASIGLPACRFMPQERLLKGAKGAVALTEREGDLLACLAGGRGRLIGREELFRTVWGVLAELDTHTLETHIYRLRGKLAEAGENPAIIEAEGGGYRLA